MSNIEYQTKSNIQIECRISNIKLNPTFKSNVEYRISNSIQHLNRMSNIEYQTETNIHSVNVRIQLLTMTNFEKLQGRRSLTRLVV